MWLAMASVLVLLVNPLGNPLAIHGESRKRKPNKWRLPDEGSLFAKKELSVQGIGVDDFQPSQGQVLAAAKCAGFDTLKHPGAQV